MATLQEYNIPVKHVYGNNSVGHQSMGYSLCFYMVTMVTQSTTLALIIEDYTFLIHNSNTDNTVSQTKLFVCSRVLTKIS